MAVIPANPRVPDAAPSGYAAGVATGRFERYAPRIARLPRRTLTFADLMINAFLLERDGDLSVCYISFERVSPDARVTSPLASLGGRSGTSFRSPAATSTRSSAGCVALGCSR